MVAIFGDPVVGRALELLLQGSLSKARFVPTSSLGEVGSLEGVRLVLLTPKWESNAGRREALLASLRAASGTAELPILELTTPSGGALQGEAGRRPEHTVSWPCSTEELEHRIEGALLAHPGG